MEKILKKKEMCRSILPTCIILLARLCLVSAWIISNEIKSNDSLDSRLSIRTFRTGHWTLSFGHNDGTDSSKVEDDHTRRRILWVASYSASINSLLYELWQTQHQNQNQALAFDNRISNQYDDRPKRRGPQPQDLGIRSRTRSLSISGMDVDDDNDNDGDDMTYIGLKPCGPGYNCFCSTLKSYEDPDHAISSWKWSTTHYESWKDAMEDLITTLREYNPRESGVDGGGYNLVTIDHQHGYLYVQFEALKNGYIDDVEFALIPDSKNGKNNDSFQVRSSSRVGYLDYGVNAKRLNYIAEKLRKKGWDAPGVDLQGAHKEYTIQNGLV
jgi:uncharacterized protein (DUF1499 family)